MNRIRIGWSILLVSVLLVAAQCNGPTDFDLGLPAEGTASSGQFSGDLSVTRRGFGGPIEVVLKDPPAGISMPKVMVAENASSAPFTITVGPGVAPGRLELVFQATGGTLVKAQPWRLTVPAPPVTPPTPDFALEARPASLTTIPGDRAVVELALLRKGSFADAVALSLDSPPPGITVGAQTPAIPAGTDNIQFQLAVDGTVAPGTYDLTLRGTAGALSRTVALRLTVAPVPDFSLALVPDTLSVTRGTSGSVTVNLTRQNGFTGEATVSLANPPAGVSAAPVTLAPGDSSAALTLNVSGSAALGSQTLTVQGTGLGLTRTAALSLSVTPVPGFAVALEFGPTLSLNQGSNTRHNLSITRTGGFVGTVTLALEGAILGSGSSRIQHSFGVNPDSGGGSYLDLTVGSSVPEGVYPLTLRGTSGSLVQTYNISLTVTRPPFSLSLSPNRITVPRGQSRTITVNITRDPGFTNPITFTTATINGLTQTFSPNPAPGTSTTLTISAAAAAPLGDFFPTMGSTGQNPNVFAAYWVTVVAGP